MTYYIDSHCHLLYNIQNKLDVLNKINQAKTFNIQKFFCICDIGEEIEKLEIISEITQENHDVFFTLGLHPTNIHNISLEKMYRIFDNFKNLIVAIGEIGIDLFQNINSLESQTFFLKEQITLAKILNKPIIIHSRNCEIEEILNLIQGTNIKFLFHCFTYDYINLEKIIKLDGFISFAGMITYKNAKNIYKNPHLIEAIRNCPLNKLIIETDMPFLSPNSHRGKENRVEYIIETYEEISKIKGISIIDLQLAVIKNIQNFFQITF